MKNKENVTFSCNVILVYKLKLKKNKIKTGLFIKIKMV